MSKEEWIKRIESECRSAGTYQDYFKSVIDTLAQVLSDRDSADEQYRAEGSQPTIIHTNRAKEKNITKNPILVMRTELNTQALALWRELGLTPKGLRMITTEEQSKKKDGLERLLKALDG